jgi:uncharacterized damage-inducible protein DinB
MSELVRIEDQLRRGLEGEAWHGPAVLELLAGVSVEQAQARPLAGIHSIWELVLHLCAGYRLVLRRLEGDGSPLTPAEDWPAAPAPTAENWQATVEELRSLNKELRQKVLKFDPGRIDQPIVEDPPYTAYTQFTGLTQHDLYHAGQIALLKRTLAERAP